MNVSGDWVAIYAYTEFVLCRISPSFETEYFKTGLHGCHHFAISDSHVIFTSQHDDKTSIGYVGRLADGRICDVEPVDFVLADGTDMKTGQFVGRGDMLHFFGELNWYCTRIDESG